MCTMGNVGAQNQHDRNTLCLARVGLFQLHSLTLLITLCNTTPDEAVLHLHH